MEISKNRSATARKSSEQPRQDTAKTALITPLRSLYSFIFPHQSSRHGIALFRPLGSIRALCRPISPVGLNTGSGSGYVLTALRAYAYATALFRPLGSIRALVIPGLRYAYPGLYSGAPSGRLSPLAQLVTSAVGRCPFPLAKSTTPAVAGVSPHRPICHICRRQMSIPHLHLWRGGGRQARGEVKHPPWRASIPHRPICHICRRQMSIPHLHLWRGGGRQAGGEVRQAGGEVKHQSMRSDVITPLKKYVHL